MTNEKFDNFFKEFSEADPDGAYIVCAMDKSGKSRIAFAGLGSRVALLGISLMQKITEKAGAETIEMIIDELESEFGDLTEANKRILS